MQTIITQTDLRAAIVQLEIRQEAEAILLKEQALLTYESIKPINLIKNLFHESTESTELKGDLLNSTIGISAGFLSKFMFQGFTSGPIRKIVGTALMFGIKNLVAHNPETVKKMSHLLFNTINNLIGSKNKKTEENKYVINDVP
jgi:hypothetical protein